jgi:hypothetical protein
MLREKKQKKLTMFSHYFSSFISSVRTKLAKKESTDSIITNNQKVSIKRIKQIRDILVSSI